MMVHEKCVLTEVDLEELQNLINEKNSSIEIAYEITSSEEASSNDN